LVYIELQHTFKAPQLPVTPLSLLAWVFYRFTIYRRTTINVATVVGNSDAFPIYKHPKQLKIPCII